MFDALVLSGGSARRLDGADKPGIEIEGVPMLDRVIAAAQGAERIVVVGPERRTRVKVRWAREEPAGGGPVSAIAAGMAHVDQEWCLVLAADLPWVASAVEPLLTAATGFDAAVLSRGGRRNHLVAVWRTEALRAAVAGLNRIAGAAARELYGSVRVTEVPDDSGWGQDCDTWDDIEQARAKGIRWGTT